MEKMHIDTVNINTVKDCLKQLQVAEEVQLEIEAQLVNTDPRPENAYWRKKAENALRIVKARRRLITSRLAVLRQEEKEKNVQDHQQHNDYLVNELRNVVSPSAFARCVMLANEKMNATSKQSQA